jgi:hypothetical protein
MDRAGQRAGSERPGSRCHVRQVGSVGDRSTPESAHHIRCARQTSELLQRCRSRVRTALAIDVMRLGLHRDRRKVRQVFSRAAGPHTRQAEVHFSNTAPEPWWERSTVSSPVRRRAPRTAPRPDPGGLHVQRNPRWVRPPTTRMKATNRTMVSLPRPSSGRPTPELFVMAGSCRRDCQPPQESATSHHGPTLAPPRFADCGCWGSVLVARCNLAHEIFTTICTLVSRTANLRAHHFTPQTERDAAVPQHTMRCAPAIPDAGYGVGQRRAPGGWLAPPPPAGLRQASVGRAMASAQPMAVRPVDGRSVGPGDGAVAGAAVE